VRLFAGLREAAGRAELEVEADCVAKLREALAEACPPLAGRLRSCRVAVRDEFVGDDAPVQDGATVDLIPPVSGG